MTVEQLATRQRVEVRSDAGGSRRIGGYAAVFSSDSENLGGFVERVAPSFFNKSRGDGWPGVVCRYNHSDDFLLGATRNGTLQLSIDETGLNYTVDLPESRSDVLELVSRGDIGKSSFAFQTFEDDWGITDRGQPLRTLVSGRLVDVAPVSQPAYQDSTVGLRSLARKMDASVEEVVALAKADGLRKLFVRSDVAPPAPMSGVAACQYIATKGRLPTEGAAARAYILEKQALTTSGARVQLLERIQGS